MQRVDYDQLSATYHSRYSGAEKLDGIARAMVKVAKENKAEAALEVGCGTGRFVEELRSVVPRVYGVDASTGMLGQAVARLGPDRLVAGRANQLPFGPSTFDLVYAINAIHHFDDPEAFLVDAVQTLRPGGLMAVVGIDPRVVRHRYFYEYFEGTLELDLQRYTSFGQLVDSFSRAGLDQVELHIVETAVSAFTGHAVLQDPFLVKESNSLLALLSQEVYRSGLKRIEADAALGKEFRSELAFGMITGVRSPSASSIRTA